MQLVQAGTDSDEVAEAVAVQADGTVLLAGFSWGSWAVSESTDSIDADMAAVLINTAVRPTPAPISPSTAPTTVTQEPSFASPTAVPTAVSHPCPVQPVTTSPSQFIEPVDTPATGLSSSPSTALGSIIGGIVGGTVLLAIVVALFRRRQIFTRMEESFDSAPSQTLPEDRVSAAAPAEGVPPPCRPVSLTEAADAPSPQYYPVLLTEAENCIGTPGK